MDEILINNFMVFHDIVREQRYDLWVGDEAWELDYYLHENPREKRAGYAWMTDFVGWLAARDTIGMLWLSASRLASTRFVRSWSALTQSAEAVVTERP